MKISVIAADGRAGKAFIKAALGAGHSIRAGVRSSSLSPTDGLQVVQCDATDVGQVQALIAGQDVVVSLLGHVKGSPDDVQTRAITVVAEAMKQQGSKRLVSLTGTGVRFEGDHITIMDRLLNLGVRIMDAPRVKDGISHVEVLKNSNLDWTVIRVLKLQNIPPRPFVLRENGPTKLFVSREEVALAILQVLAQKSFIKKAPIISSL